MNLAIGGTSKFRITGIDPLVDSTDPKAFPLKLAFNKDFVSFKMTALERPISTGVPEPTGFTLLALGLAGVGLRRRKDHARA